MGGWGERMKSKGDEGAKGLSSTLEVSAIQTVKVCISEK